MFLEVIAQNIEDICQINLSLADQIEFCHDLSHDGLSPSVAAVKRASVLAQKPLMVMLRKNTNGFELNDRQIAALIAFINQVDHLPFKGYVFGAIKAQSLDQKALGAIVKHLNLIKSQKVITFHKAFDLLKDPQQGLNQLSNYPRVTQLLTRGLLEPASANIFNLKQLKHPKIKIVIGGGINAYNYQAFVKAGLDQLHIGQAARLGNSWNQAISFRKINAFKASKKF